VDGGSAAPQGQVRSSAVALSDGGVLLIGGVGAGPAYPALHSAEIYDPTANAWTLIDGPAIASWNSSATLLRDGRVFVTDWVSTDPTWTPHRDRQVARLFDPRTRTWTTGPATDLVLGFSRSILLGNGTVLVVGGTVMTEGGAWPWSRRAAVFNPARMTWTAVGPMLHRRFQFALAPLPGGRVIALGPGRTSEIYDPKTRSWTASGLLRARRADPLAIGLQDGRVFVAGWEEAVWSMPFTELFDPATETWRDAGYFPLTLQLTATRLLDGRVLLAGGRWVRSCTQRLDDWTVQRPGLQVYRDCTPDSVTDEVWIFDPAAVP
jgi:hypothetical protein